MRLFVILIEQSEYDFCLTRGETSKNTFRKKKLSRLEDAQSPESYRKR